MIQSDPSDNSNNILTSSSSGHTLFKQMYFDLTAHQLILGDGRYTEYNGLYYMHTDAGYMRNILFFGISGMIALIIYQLYLLSNIAIFPKKKLFVLTMLLMLLIFEVKGQTIGFLLTLQSIILLLSNYSYINKRYKSTKREIIFL
jgi:hypothetical protein